MLVSDVDFLGSSGFVADSSSFDLLLGFGSFLNSLMNSFSSKSSGTPFLTAILFSVFSLHIVVSRHIRHTIESEESGYILHMQIGCMACVVMPWFAFLKGGRYAYLHSFALLAFQSLFNPFFREVKISGKQKKSINIS